MRMAARDDRRMARCAGEKPERIETRITLGEEELLAIYHLEEKSK